MRSAWLCSWNDVLANGFVLVAALGVTVTGSSWPDIVVGLGIAALFATSAVSVVRQALAVPQRSRRGAAPVDHELDTTCRRGRSSVKPRGIREVLR